MSLLGPTHATVGHYPSDQPTLAARPFILRKQLRKRRRRRYRKWFFALSCPLVLMSSATIGHLMAERGLASAPASTPPAAELPAPAHAPLRRPPPRAVNAGVVRASSSSTLDLRSKRPGQATYLDGRYVGRLPLTISNIKAGYHLITIATSLNGRDEIAVTLTSGETRVLSVDELGIDRLAQRSNEPLFPNLETKTTAKLRSAANRSFRTDVEERSGTRTPSSPSKVSHAHDLGPEAAPAAPSILAAGDEAAGTLMLNAKPPSSIFINGKATGLMTPQRSLRLAEGLYDVELRNAEHDLQSHFRVRIASKRRTRVAQDLRASP